MPVRGARQVAGNLRALSNYVSVPLNAASRFALQPTLSTAKKNARALPTKEKTGTLAASLTIKRAPKSAKIRPVHKVGPDASFERQTVYGLRKPVKYAHLLEFGTASGVSPTPFLTPAYLATKDQVVKRFGDKIGPEMEKRAAKIRSRVR